MKSIEVAAGIIWKEGRFLAAKRPKDKPRGGYWEFPGGKREAGESMIQALCRELREELAIDGVAASPWRVVTHDYGDMRVELHFMHVLAFTGEPEARDGQELRWVSPEEAQSLSFLPADEAVIADIRVPDWKREDALP